jgi:hypothetical protein
MLLCKIKSCFTASALRIKITTKNLENKKRNKTVKPVGTYLNGMLLFAGSQKLVVKSVEEGDSTCDR